MLEIVSLLLCLLPEISHTTLRQLSRIALAMLAMKPCLASHAGQAAAEAIARCGVSSTASSPGVWCSGCYSEPSCSTPKTSI